MREVLYFSIGLPQNPQVDSKKYYSTMDRKIFTREIWEPGKGEYLVEIENPETIPLDTPCGKRKALLIRVDNEPYVWLINHQRRPEKEIETQLENILSKRKAKTEHIKVIVNEPRKKTYKLEKVRDPAESVAVSFGIYISDGEGRICHLIHSDVIQIGGEK